MTTLHVLFSVEGHMVGGLLLFLHPCPQDDSYLIGNHTISIYFQTAALISSFQRSEDDLI